ncbi:hypothetical protein F3Y22_tig00112231pilonHSYRG00234 [Hibiscus syriacus]|uniref:Translation elongation factor EFTu-like domain-containing protein n=1 Tax=Hibiscus syriacus TaxID=106335 RepID=A0A6A2X3G6_HIBSY|nr:hypothetical protein F3Y22_tig00112231pilonHSYRG00234 [Hibiscus syriacus]
MVIGLDCSKSIRCSAKEGIGITEILNAIVERIPPPPDVATSPLRALIFDSYYDPYRGVIVYFRVIDGKIKKGDRIYFMASQKDYFADEVGVLSPNQLQVDELYAGEVGYLSASIRSVADARVGDTITHYDRKAKSSLPGYEEATPMVFCGLFPVDADQFPELRDALEKLQLNDAALKPGGGVRLVFSNVGVSMEDGCCGDKSGAVRRSIERGLDIYFALTVSLYNLIGERPRHCPKEWMDVVTRNNLYAVEGVVDGAKLQVLGNYLMGWCKNFIKIGNLASQMQDKGLGGFSLMRVARNVVLLIFENSATLRSVKNEKSDTLAEWFSSVAAWLESLVMECRRVWVACEGILFHAWNWGSSVFSSGLNCTDEDVAIEVASLEKVSLLKSTKGVENSSNKFGEDDLIKSGYVGVGLGLSPSPCSNSGCHSTKALDHSNINIVEHLVDKSVDPSDGVIPWASEDVLMMGLFPSNGLPGDAIQLQEDTSAVPSFPGKLSRNRVVKKGKQKKGVLNKVARTY